MWCWKYKCRSSRFYSKLFTLEREREARFEYEASTVYIEFQASQNCIIRCLSQKKRKEKEREKEGKGEGENKKEIEKINFKKKYWTDEVQHSSRLGSDRRIPRIPDS